MSRATIGFAADPRIVGTNLDTDYRDSGYRRDPELDDGDYDEDEDEDEGGAE